MNINEFDGKKDGILQKNFEKSRSIVEMTELSNQIIADFITFGELVKLLLGYNTK